VALYRGQLEVLSALFARLFSGDDKPIPHSALNSSFPIVRRLFEKHPERIAEEPID